MTLKAKQKLLTIDTRLKLLYNSVLHSLVPPAYSSLQVKIQDSSQVKTPDFQVHGIAPWSLSPAALSKNRSLQKHVVYIVFTASFPGSIVYNPWYFLFKKQC